jgi:2-oxoglutarate ferredoxin oxidoreductase subunit gamma
MKMKKTEIRFGGSGGQGVVLAARILGKAAVLDGRNALQTQAYGSESRGSLTRSEVIISDGKIGFPAVRQSDVLITMTQEATDVFRKDLKEGGVLIVDSTNVKSVSETGVQVRRFPITDTAKRNFGDALYANMVMLGVLLQVMNLLSVHSVEEAIAKGTSKQSAETNIRAFRQGLRLTGQ